MSDPQPPHPPILGRFQPLSELAKSPMGGLVLALDTSERHAVAVRSLPSEARLSPGDRALLLEAGRWVKGLDDPAIMRPVEIGTQDGLFHQAHRYAMSEPLRAVLRLATFRGELIPIGVALRITHDVALGARAVEAWGAPPAFGESLCGGLIADSVMVGQDGRTRLCDAGMVPVLRRTQEYGQQAEVLSYSAPEQLETTGTADGRSDVFSIGVLLWEMLANRRLFAAPLPSDVIDKVLNLPVPAIESLQRPAGEAIFSVIERALAREPHQRYPGTTALLQALETHASAQMATVADVSAYVTHLMGNVFDTRTSALERAIQQLGSEAPRPSPPVVLRALSNPDIAAELEARGGLSKTHKSTPRNLVPIPPPPPRTSRGTPSQPDIPDPGPRKTQPTPSAPFPRHIKTPLPANSNTPPPRLRMSSNPPVIAALMDDAIAQGKREAQERQNTHGAANFELPSSVPLQKVLPSVSSSLELPGAELFATPGFTSVKTSSTGVPPQTAQQGGPALAPPESPMIGSEASELVALADLEELQDPSSSEASPETPHVVSVALRPWLPIACAIMMAFVGGLGIRQCMKNRGLHEVPAASAASTLPSGAATTPNSDQVAGNPEQPVATATQVLGLGVPDAAVADQAAAVAASDAGVVTKPAVRKPPTARPRKHKSHAAPRYNGAAPQQRSKTKR